ncbi:MAG: permease [Eubacteriales bacterium]|nr:permease [Eubacteriales bacterium]
MRKISAFTVCGFLDAGKTAYINDLLMGRDGRIGVIQFETGEEEIMVEEGIAIRQISYRNLRERMRYVAQEIFTFLAEGNFDEVWIEVNGMMDMRTADEIFRLKFDRVNAVADLLHFEQTFYITTPRILADLMQSPDTAVLSQIVRSDTAVVRTDNMTAFRRTKTMLKNISGDLSVSRWHEEPADLGENRPVPAWMRPVTVLIWLIVALIAADRFIPTDILPVRTVLTIFAGILLQSFPFLLLGVLLSSMIQILVPARFVERHFPKNTAVGILFAAVSGFFFPVCDCATIPVFRSLIQKGVPLPAAVTFMVATPVINPVVILSTLSAFNGDWRMVALRCGFGLLAAVVIGLISGLIKNRDVIRTGRSLMNVQTTYAYPDESRFVQIVRHMQGEFMNVAKYLLIGAAISAVIQTGMAKIPWLNHGSGTVLSILILMGMAFLLSLCSSSDAVIAKSFSSHFPAPAIFAFLIYGPMVDLKNIILLSANFKKRFIRNLTLIITGVCLAVTAIVTLLLL